MSALVHGERGTGTLLVSLGARPEEVSLDLRLTRASIRVNFSTMVMSVQRERKLPKKLAHDFGNFEMAAQLALQTVTSTARFVRGVAASGVFVRALARNPDSARNLEGPGIEVVIGDADDPGVIDGLAEGIDVIYHLASVMKGSWEEFERLDMEGSRHLLGEANRAGVRRFVYTSTMAAYPLGDLPNGTVVTEESVPADTSDRIGHYARSKLAVEKMLMDANAAGEIEAVVTRPGLVFGPWASPFLTHPPHLGTLTGDRTPMDMYRYARLRVMYERGHPSAESQRTRVRSLGRAVVECRASQDVYTFENTFLDGFYLPPAGILENGTIVDLGSHVGYTVAHMAHLFPSARVLGVGMEAQNLRLAERNTARFHVTGEAIVPGAKTAPARRLATLLGRT